MSGGSDSASREAAASEERRQASIRNTQNSVNDIFNSPQRAADIADYVAANRQYLGDDLTRQKKTNDQQLKFALARNGQIGGSTQVDQQQRFGEDYSRGLLDVERRAQGAGAELESADQDARANLISLATTGLDATTASQQAAAAMRTSLQAGKSTSMVQGLGDMFGGFKDFYQKSQEAKVRRDADRNAYNNFYVPTASTGFYYGKGAGQ